MIAIPVKNNRPDSAITPLFGQAKWFALVDKNGEITFWENKHRSAYDVAHYLKSQNVRHLIFQEIGEKPYNLITNIGIMCYHAGQGRVLLNDALAYLGNDSLFRVSANNMAEYVQHARRHRRKGEHHGQHHHAHTHVGHHPLH